MREGPAARGARERERLQRHVFARARNRGNCVISLPPPRMRWLRERRRLAAVYACRRVVRVAVRSALWHRVD